MVKQWQAQRQDKKRTGSGLTRAEIEDGEVNKTGMSHIVFVHRTVLMHSTEQRNRDYPWMEIMDNYWQGVPNIDAKTTTSTPGQSLAEAAQQTFMPSKKTSRAEDPEYETDDELDSTFTGDEDGGTHIYGSYLKVCPILSL